MLFRRRLPSKGKLLAGGNKSLRILDWCSRQNSVAQIQNMADAAELRKNLLSCVANVIVRRKQNRGVKVSL